MSAVTISREDESATDATVQAAIDRVIGDSFFAKPKQVCALLGISLSTYNRAVRAGLIQTTPRGDYEAVSRPVLRPLLKYGFGSTVDKKVA